MLTLSRFVCFLTTLTGLIAGVDTDDLFTAGSDLLEYCQWETFKASCQPDEVIVITDAFYGRMQYGRCILPEYGHAGCYVNVRSLTEARCSGRQTCRFTIPNALFDGTKPCREDLKLYLMAGYRCETVLTMTKAGSCRNPSEGSLSSSGLLASTTTISTGCGTVETPWIITVRPGQRINITLFDFTTSGSGGTQESVGLNASGGRVTSGVRSRAGDPTTGSTTCRVYAVVKDTGSGKSFTVCGGPEVRAAVDGRKDKFSDRPSSYLSDSHVTEVRLPSVRMNAGGVMTSPDEPDGGQYMLKYQAVGCADVTSPEQVTWSRSGRNATMVCSDGRTLHVTCREEQGTWAPRSVVFRAEGVEWEDREDGSRRGDGMILAVNCSVGDMSDPRDQSLAMKVFPLSQIGATTLILLIAAIVGLIIFLIGVCLIRSKRRRIRQREAANMSAMTSSSEENKLQPIICYGHPGGASDGKSTYYQSVKWAGSPQTAAPCSRSYSYASEPHRAYTDAQYESDGNEYAYVDDLQLAPVSLPAMGTAQGYSVTRSTGAAQGYGHPSCAMQSYGHSAGVTRGHVHSVRGNNNAYGHIGQLSQRDQQPVGSGGGGLHCDGNSACNDYAMTSSCCSAGHVLDDRPRPRQVMSQYFTANGESRASSLPRDLNSDV